MSSSYQSKIVERGFSNRPGRGIPVEKSSDGKNTLRHLVRYFRSEMKLVIFMSVIVCVGVAGSVLAPAFQSTAIDRIISGEYDALPPYLTRMLAAYILYGISLLVQGYVSSSLSQRVVKKIRADLFNHTIRLPIRYTDNHSHGDVISRMTNDADNISTVISTSLGTMFSAILTLAGTVIMMLRYSVPLTLLSCSTIVLTILFTNFITSRVRKYYRRRQELLGKVNANTEEMITNIRTVTAYNRQTLFIKRFNETADELTRTGIMSEIISGSMGPVMNFLGNVGFVIVAVFGAWFAVKGWITVGVISAFIIYSRQFSRPINELAELYGQVETAIAGAERIFAVLDEPGEDPAGEAVPENMKGVVEFRNVCFSYVPGKPVIRDFSLKVDSGKKIALVGATGSGKTTIINLLMRFYDVDSGEILLDGINIRDLSLASLRDSIGIVLQDTILFSDTVRANLCYAKPGAAQEELDQAVRDSNSDKIIAQLPDGYDTVLSEAGENLSQGQRQLLAIGRAFLSYPKILILDEATSSVDTRTEMNIQNAMNNLMQERTSLIIAHRLSTIQDADLIVVMDHGQIVEMGSHRQLLKSGGSYHKLYMAQFAGNTT